jgi:hypothetical protein
MKNLLITLVAVFTTASIFAATPPEVNEKVLKAFEKTFASPGVVTWYEYDSYYEANFKQTGIISRVRYDMEGNMIGTTRYYYEQQLPLNILTRLKNRYPGRSIYGVTELSEQDETSYYVVMTDSKNWYTVKSDISGNMEQTEKFKKN